jgi:drug/metabolite transporter (DMT)-like permease
MSRDTALGVLGLLGGVGLFSTVEITGKIIGRRIDPGTLTFFRFAVTALVLLAIAVPRRWGKVKAFRGRDYGIFFLNGFIGIALGISLFHAAILVFEKAASSAVVFSANPVFVLVLARFINHEHWELRKWVAVGLGALGVSCFAWESGAFTAGSLLGLGLMLLSAFFFALSICISKRVIPAYGPMLLMGFSAATGSLLLAPWAWVSLARDGTQSLVNAWLPLLYIAVLGTAVAYALYYFGIMKTSANGGSMAFFLKPVLACVLAAIILGEHINLPMIVGAVLIISGVCVVMLPVRGRCAAREKDRPPPTPAVE